MAETITAPIARSKCREGDYISETKNVSWERFQEVMNATAQERVGFLLFRNSGLEIYSINARRIVTVTQALLDGFGGSRLCAQILEFLEIPPSVYEEINELVKHEVIYTLIVSRQRPKKNTSVIAKIQSRRSHPEWTWHFIC